VTADADSPRRNVADETFGKCRRDGSEAENDGGGGGGSLGGGGGGGGGGGDDDRGCCGDC